MKRIAFQTFVMFLCGLAKASDPVFQIGAYCLPTNLCTDAIVADVKSAHVDFVIDNFRLNTEVYDVFHRQGVGVYDSSRVPDWWGGHTNSNGRMSELLPLPEYEACVRRRLVTHPALWRVSIGDEPSALDFPHYAKCLAVVRKHYPDTPAFLNLHPSTQVRPGLYFGVTNYVEYIKAYDRLLPLDHVCYDLYPYSRPRDFGMARFYESFRITAETARDSNRALWFVGQVNNTVGKSAITANQLRYQANAALAFGAEKMIWACWGYGWWTNNVLTRAGAKTPQYDRVKEVNAELKRLAPFCMRFKWTDSRLTGFTGTAAKWLAPHPAVNVPQVNFNDSDWADTDFFTNVRADDGLPLVVASLMPRAEKSGERAIFVFAADDPYDERPATRVVRFRTTLGNVKAEGPKGPVAIDRSTDGTYSMRLSSSQGVLITGEAVWAILGALPQFDAQRMKTAARWLWHCAHPGEGDAALFRCEFTVDSPVAKGNLSFSGDDVSELYLNGTKIEPRQFAKAVRPGRNVFAARVTNIKSSGGMIAFADLTLQSGAVFSLRSDAKTFRSRDAKGAPDDWASPDCPDAAWWKPAYEMGDALMLPFSRYRDYTPSFATAEERAKIAEIRQRAMNLTLPAGIADEPEPVARIVYEGNRPFIELNGVREEPDFTLTGADHDMAVTAAIKGRALGYRIFQVFSANDRLEKAPGVYDFSDFDVQVRRILHYIPDARFILSNRIEFPKWCEAHREECIGYAAGEIGTASGDERLGRPLRPSVASAAYRAEVNAYLEKLGAFIRAQPWGKRIIGIRPSWGIYTEWHCYGMYQGADVGPAMTAAFHRFASGKYAGEKPPTMEERTNKATLLDPVKQRKVMDFYACMAEQVSDHLIGTARQVKRVLPGRLAGFYYGYVFAVHPPEGANVMVEKVLAAPEVDFLSDPSMYSANSRRAGGSYYHRAVPAVFHRYGKLSVIEDDMRFHHVRPWQPSEKAIATETPRESRMTMRRNCLNKLFDGSGIQLCDPCAGRGIRPFTYDDPWVSLAIAESQAVLARVGIQPMDSGNDTAIVINPLERFRRDGSIYPSRQTSAIYCALEWLYRTGCVFDVLTLNDYLASARPYRRVVMMNLFGLSASLRAKVLAKVRCPDVTTLWLVAPGSVTPDGFSDRAMSDLVGMALAGSGIEPKVRCADAAAQAFVQGGAIKTLADGSRAAFLPDAPNTEAKWREALVGLGAVPVCPPENYVRRHGDLLLFHNAKAGGFSLTPPKDLAGRSAVELYSGRTYAPGQINLTTDGCDTRLFKFASSGK